LMTAIAQAMLRARVECRRLHGRLDAGAPERAGGEVPLSDHAQVIVDVEVSERDAKALAERLRAWLVEEGIIEPAPTEGDLEQGWGYTPGPHFRKALESGHVEEQFLDLGTNRVCFPTGRRVFDAGGNGIELACPFCGATFMPGPEWSDAVGAWYEGDDEASFPCPFCGKAERLAAWRGPWPWGFGCLASEFWNWPPLSAKFVEEVARRLAHRIVLVRCHV
jgi:uncharacterized Zn-finger protein